MAKQIEQMSFRFSCRFSTSDMPFHGVLDIAGIRNETVEKHKDKIVQMCKSYVANTLCDRWGVKPQQMIFFEVYYYERAIFDDWIEYDLTEKEIIIFKWEK